MLYIDGALGETHRKAIALSKRLALSAPIEPDNSQSLDVEE